jgi:nucleoside-diphosphate-sugar epimerase
MDKVKVLVAGASGFIGFPLVKKLSSAGYEVMCLSRKCIETNSEEYRSAYWLQSDLSSPKTYREEVKKFYPEIVVYLSWQDIPDFSLDKSLLNLKQSLELLNFILDFESCKKIIVSGSCFELNQLQGKCLEVNEGEARDHFTWAKLCLYSWLKMICSQKKIDLAWMRIFYVYGPHQRQESLIPDILTSLKKGQLPDIRTPINANDFVYVDDVANAFSKAVSTNFPSGIYNLGSGKSTSVLEVCRIAEQIVLGTESLTAQLESKTQNSRCEVNFWADIKHSKEIMDWQPTTSLKEGIQQTQQWIDSQ